VLYAEEFERPDYNEMLQKTWELILRYDPTKIFIGGGSNPSFIRSLKLHIRFFMVSSVIMLSSS
jgi:hypothetical protein